MPLLKTESPTLAFSPSTLTTANFLLTVKLQDLSSLMFFSFAQKNVPFGLFRKTRCLGWISGNSIIFHF